MTLRYLLDTMIVSSPASKVPMPEIVKRLHLHGHESAIAAPVWHELTYGFQRMPPGRRRVSLESYLHDVVRPAFPILPYDEPAADWHGRERARLAAFGKAAPYAAGQIAAIAHVNGLTLVTLNVRDFSRFRDLAVETWAGRVRK